MSILTRKSRKQDPVEYEVTKTEDEWKQELPADRYRRATQGRYRAGMVR